jgi:hypothetical protein
MRSLNLKRCIVAAILALTMCSSAQTLIPAVPLKADLPARLPEQDDVIENGNYTNRFFGFSLPIPEGWQAENYDTSQANRKKYAIGIVPKGFLSKPAIPPPFGAVLFAMHPTSDLPGMTIGQIDLKNIHDVKVPSDITIPLAEAMKTEQGQFRVEEMKGPLPYSLGQRIASRFDYLARDEQNQASLPQTVIITIVENHALIFAITGDPKMGLEVLESIRFRPESQSPVEPTVNLIAGKISACPATSELTNFQGHWLKVIWGPPSDVKIDIASYSEGGRITFTIPYSNSDWHSSRDEAAKDTSLNKLFDSPVRLDFRISKAGDAHLENAQILNSASGEWSDYKPQRPERFCWINASSQAAAR